MRLDKEDHRSWVLRAVACAEHGLPHFEEDYPEDGRSRRALEAGRAWVRGEVALSEAPATLPPTPSPQTRLASPAPSEAPSVLSVTATR